MKKELSIKQVYIRRFKNERPKENMKDDTTFTGLLDCMENHKSINEYLFTNNPNELIRSRVISLLTEEMGLEYDYVKNLLRGCRR